MRRRFRQRASDTKLNSIMKRVVCSLALAASIVGGPSIASDISIPKFTEETASSGIDNVYLGEWEYMAGGGVAAFDCSGDGFPDLLFAGGEAKAKFYLNESKVAGPLLFKEQPSGLELDKVTGAYPIDIDSDGNSDLALLRVGENVLMRGLGGCRFERANEAWGFDGGEAWSTAFAATWEKGATWPTLAIGNYIDRKEEAEPWGSCTDNWLHRPKEKSFTPPLPLKPSYCALSMLFTDWSRSGMPSLRVSNDREYYEGGGEQLWKIEPGKTPELYTAADGWKRLRIWGMGIASADLDGDGYPEYFLTSMADNRLQSLEKPKGGGAVKPTYKETAFNLGVTAHRPHTGEDLKPSTAWHTQFEDVNNDGRLDLFIAKGNVAKMPDFAMRDPNNLLLQLPDGKFREASVEAGVASGGISRGGAIADFNLDGRLDLVVTNRWEKAQIWRNTSKDAGNWLAVKLAQPDTNRDAIGAWIEVKRGDAVTRREVNVGGGHASGQLGWIHLGLGAAANANVRVIWPDGIAREYANLSTGQFLVLSKNMAAPVVWKPKRGSP
jgi:hypothetical protein